MIKYLRGRDEGRLFGASHQGRAGTATRTALGGAGRIDLLSSDQKAETRVRTRPQTSRLAPSGNFLQPGLNS